MKDLRRPTTDLEEVLTEHRGQLLERLERRIGPALRARLDADDVVQDASLAALDERADLEARGTQPLLAWFLVTCEYRLRAALRRPPSEGLPDETGHSDPSARSRADEREQGGDLLRSADALRPDQRMLLKLRSVLDVPWETLEFLSGRTPQAVRKAHARARRALVERAPTTSFRSGSRACSSS